MPFANTKVEETEPTSQKNTEIVENKSESGLFDNNSIGGNKLFSNKPATGYVPSIFDTNKVVPNVQEIAKDEKTKSIFSNPQKNEISDNSNKKSDGLFGNLKKTTLFDSQMPETLFPIPEKADDVEKSNN